MRSARSRRGGAVLRRPVCLRPNIWTAISLYVLVAILKKDLLADRSLYELLHILRLTMFKLVLHS